MSVWERLRAADRALFGLARRLTPGQRWTVAAALIFATLVLVWGLPTVTMVPPRPGP
jgi:hypothetical protein